MRSDLAATLHHEVARMWKFDPEEVIVPVGSAIDIYVSTPDVTHEVILLGTDLNRMVATGQIDKNRPALQDQENLRPLKLGT
jgi:heme/copper-type cytochrome/quinol oxidase subunit 2